ncbi:hypothetical protein MMC25_007636 [Agyrium rufum]|nr:hypothetical protein [Agyrium rufum]
MASPVDILIIGGSPAGLTAATTLVRQSHTAIVFDAGTHRNDKEYRMHMVAIRDHKLPKEFREEARKELDHYGTVRSEDKAIASVKKGEHGSFGATEDVYPDIDGICPGDDHPAYMLIAFIAYTATAGRRKTMPAPAFFAVGEISSVLMVLHIAHPGLRMTPEITLHTPGNTNLAEDLIVELAPTFTPHIKIDSHGPEKMEGFLGHKPQSKLKGPFAKQFGLNLTPLGNIVVEPPFFQPGRRDALLRAILLAQ